MLASERKRQILIKLSTTGQIQSAELVKEFSVSEDTIRRDLKDMADAGQLKKVHGGAVAITTVPYDYTARKELNIEAKSAIAKRVLPLIRNGMVIFIDGGTTCAQLAYHLPHSTRATFITHSVPTAMALSQLRNLKVIMLGGELITDLLVTTGPDIVAQASRFKPDLSIVSAHGVAADEGATVENWDDACIKSTFIKNSAESAVLAGHEKLGFSASYKLADIKDLDYLVTDGDAKQLKPFSTAGITILSA